MNLVLLVYLGNTYPQYKLSETMENVTNKQTKRCQLETSGVLQEKMCMLIMMMMQVKSRDQNNDNNKNHHL